MPFIRKGKCVFRKDTGKKKGCSKTESGAKKYMRALYAHSKDTKEAIDKYATEEEKEMLKEMGYGRPKFLQSETSTFDRPKEKHYRADLGMMLLYNRTKGRWEKYFITGHPEGEKLFYRGSYWKLIGPISKDEVKRWELSKMKGREDFKSKSNVVPQGADLSDWIEKKKTKDAEWWANNGYGVGEDIDKYATAEEKEFLKESIPYDLPVDPDFLRARADKQRLQKVLRSESSEIEKTLGKRKGRGWRGPSHGVTLTNPFNKSGVPRKYLKVLLALEDNPGMTKKEIYRDVLSRDYSSEKIRSQDTASLWGPLSEENLIKSVRDVKTTRYFTGPAWPEYRKNILGLDAMVDNVFKGADEFKGGGFNYPPGFDEDMIK